MNKEELKNQINAALQLHDLTYNDLFSHRFTSSGIREDRCPTCNSIEEFEQQVQQYLDAKPHSFEIYIQIDDSDIFKAECNKHNPSDIEIEEDYPHFTMGDKTIYLIID